MSNSGILPLDLVLTFIENFLQAINIRLFQFSFQKSSLPNVVN